MAKYPANMPYQEETIKALANGVPHRLSGLWNFVEILATDDATDAQEVSFNDGQTWTRLRKGIFVPIGLDDESGRYEGTVGLAFRNNTGGDVTLSVAVGYGAIVDARLLVDGSQGTVPVSSAQLPAALDASGNLKVSTNTRTMPALNTFSGFANATGTGAGLTTVTIVAAGTNVNGVRIYKGGYFWVEGAPDGICHLFADNGTVVGHIAGFVVQDVGGGGNMQVMDDDLIIPAGCNLKLTFAGSYSYGFNYKVL